MSELKPCPFHMHPIGPVLYTGYDEGNGSPESGGWWATLECPKCDSVSMSEVECPDEAQAIESARAKWNTRAERTCHYFPDSMQVAFDENDEEIETGEAYSDGCDYTCSACGFTMLGGDEGWFFETPGEYGGWNYKARFNYCPNCGAKVSE